MKSVDDGRLTCCMIFAKLCMVWKYSPILRGYWGYCPSGCENLKFPDIPGELAHIAGSHLATDRDSLKHMGITHEIIE